MTNIKDSYPWRKIEIYDNYLYFIANTKFTLREIDVVSCVIHNRSEKKIANILNVSHRTVGTHIRNVLNKFGKNSRDDIIDIIESSGKRAYLSEYYLHLLIQSCFENHLKKLNNILTRTKAYLVFNEPSNKIIKTITHHLNMANCELGLKLNHINEDAFVIQVLSAGSQISAVNGIHSSKQVILQIEATPNFLPTNNDLFLNFTERTLYYQNLLSLLKIIYKHSSVDKTIKEFKKECSHILESWHGTNSSEFVHSQQTLKNKLLIRKNRKLLLFITLLFLTAIVISSKYLIHQEDNVIHSDLIIPVKQAFLERPKIIENIDKQLHSETKGIKTVALTGIIGIGGAGKTTLARYYAKNTEDYSLVWELNAENTDSLISSFQDLSYAIASTPEEKTELEFINRISDTVIKEKLLINYVKLQLKKQKNWLLIYDNVDTLTRINHLFPTDSTQWGNGHVLITTRNEHIAETSFINSQDVIHVDELNTKEMSSLFAQILYDSEYSKLKQQDQESVLLFLKSIPPFPLDVSIAAYTVKNTHITFKQYLNIVKENSIGYEGEKLKFGASDYDKTRYGIVSETLNRINKQNTDANELFFFISLMRPQHIPIELLHTHRNNIEINDFVYDLRKNGLLVRESYTNFAQENKSISVHDSTHEIITAFLNSALSQQEKELFIQRINESVNKFYQKCMNKQDVQMIQSFIPHLKSMLNALRDLDIKVEIREKFEADIHLILGYAYYTTIRNFIQAIYHMRASYNIEEKMTVFSKLTTAKLLKDMGLIYSVINDLDNSLKYCQESIRLCKGLSNTNALVADNLQVMSAVYRKQNSFNVANDLLQKAVSIIANQNNAYIDNLRAEIYTQLSCLYLAHYMNKPKGQVAIEYSKQAIKAISNIQIFYKNKSSLPLEVTCNLARQRWKYSEALMVVDNNYEEANENALEAEYIMKRKCPADMHQKSRILGVLGEVSLRYTNNIEQAKEQLSETVNIINLAFGTSAAVEYYVHRAEANIRLNKYREGYDDCMHIINIGQTVKTNALNLRFYTTFYHAAVASYHMNDLDNAIKHLQELFDKLQEFSKNFLETEIYNNLVSKGVFSIRDTKPQTKLEIIKQYLDNSVEIFGTIHGHQHPFVTDYVLKNSQDFYRAIEIQNKLNTRPSKTLGFVTPLEYLENYYHHI